MKVGMKRLFVIPVLSLLVLTFLMSGCGPSVPTTTTPEPPPEQSPFPTQPDPLTQLVVDADLIVLGTITDEKYDIVTVEPNRKYTHTIFTLSVEKVIKGDPTITQLFIRTPGGEVVKSYFFIKDRILALLNRGNDNYYTLSTYGSTYGIYWMESPTAGARSIGKLQDAIANILQIMTANNIPIALPTSEWPPLPTGPISLPK